MYRIGIVDDAPEDRADIQVAILDPDLDKGPVQFKEYELLNRKKDQILKEIMDDVTEGTIQALIVDYRLDTTEVIIEGWEIVDCLHEEAPEFPMVILTHAPEEGKVSPYTDADKVYAKKIFLKANSQESKSMVENIFLNMDRYVSNRKRLEAALEMELCKLDENSTDEKVLRHVMELETRLKGYKQMSQTAFDTGFDLGELKSVLEELKKYEELLGNR